MTGVQLVSQLDASGLHLLRVLWLSTGQSGQWSVSGQLARDVACG